MDNFGDAVRELSDWMRRTFTSRDKLHTFLLQELSIDDRDLAPANATLDVVCSMVSEWFVNKHRYADVAFALVEHPSHTNIPSETLRMQVTKLGVMQLPEDLRQSLVSEIATIDPAKLGSVAQEIFLKENLKHHRACLSKPENIVGSLNYYGRLELLLESQPSKRPFKIKRNFSL